MGYKQTFRTTIKDFEPNDLYGKRLKTRGCNSQVICYLKQPEKKLFTNFLGSAVRVGEQWKIASKQEGEFGLNVKSFIY